jgi:ABC-type polar amino acid transport system ATPase subunit
MSFARRSADRVYFFSGGRIVEEGPPDHIFDAPVETLTKSFVRHIAQGAAA